jgi:hypothetical protein
MNSTARRELSRIEADSKETVVNEIIHFNFDPAVESTILDMFDDWEYAQQHGIHFDDDSLRLITVDSCIEEMQDRITSQNDPEETMREEIIIEYLKQFKGFTIWM